MNIFHNFFNEFKHLFICLTVYEYPLLLLLCIVSSSPAVEETKSESDDSLSTPKNPLIKEKLSKETERYDSPFSIRRIKAIKPERFLARQSTSNNEKKSRKKAEDKHQNEDNNNDEKNEGEIKKKFSRKKSEDRRRTDKKASERRRTFSRE